MTNRTLPLPHIPLPTTFFSRTRALQQGLLTRGGFGEENTLADAIPPFHYSLFTVFPVSCFFSHLQNSLHHSFPFSDTTRAVSNGWLYYWMGFLCSVALCMRIDSTAHVFRFRAVSTAKRIIQGAKVCKAGGRTILYEGIPRELTAIPSKNFRPRDNTS